MPRQAVLYETAMWILRAALILSCSAIASSPVPPAAPAPHPVDAIAVAEFDRVLSDLRARVMPDDLGAAKTDIADPWIGTSDHYRVSALRSRKVAAISANILEGANGFFKEFLGVTRSPSSPFEAVIYPSITEYNELGEARYDERSSITGAFYADDAADGFLATYDSTNWNLLAQNLTYGAFQQYINWAFPNADPPAVLEQGLAAYFASWATPALAQYTKDQFEILRSGEDAARPWIPLTQLITGNRGSFTNRTSDRFTELAQLILFLQFHYPDTKVKEDGTAGPFQEYVRLVFNRDRAAIGHPVYQLLTQKTSLLEGALKGYRGW